MPAFNSLLCYVTISPILSEMWCRNATKLQNTTVFARQPLDITGI